MTWRQIADEIARMTLEEQQLEAKFAEPYDYGGSVYVVAIRRATRVLVDEYGPTVMTGEPFLDVA